MRLFASVLLASSIGFAQNTTMPLSLKRAVEIALAPDGSTKIALAQETIQQAQERLAESRAAFLPDLDSSIQDRRQTTNLKAYGFTFNLPVAGFSIPSIVGPYSVFDARATVQQSVLDISSYKRYKSSRTSLAATRSDFDGTRNQVQDEIARDYLIALRADADRDTARANVDLSQALLDLAQRQKNAGSGTGIEIVRAQVQLANDRQRLIQAENGRTRAILQLLRAMNLDLASPVELTDKLEYRPIDTSQPNVLLEEAHKMRPELRAQQQREEASRLNYGSVKSERLPSIGASGDYGTIGQSIPGTHPTYTLGASLKVPIWDGGRREARIGDTFSQYRQEQVRTKDLAQQIELQVRVALENLRSAAAEVDAARDGLTLADNELAQARRRYEAGVGTSVEVTDAQTRLQRARDNQVGAIYDYNLAHLDLATATGTIGDYVNQ